MTFAGIAVHVMLESVKKPWLVIDLPLSLALHAVLMSIPLKEGRAGLCDDQDQFPGILTGPGIFPFCPFQV